MHILQNSSIFTYNFVCKMQATTTLIVRVSVYGEMCVIPFRLLSYVNPHDRI